MVSTPRSRNSLEERFTASEMSRKRYGSMASGITISGVSSVVTPIKPIPRPVTLDDGVRRQYVLAGALIEGVGVYVGEVRAGKTPVGGVLAFHELFAVVAVAAIQEAQHLLTALVELVVADGAHVEVYLIHGANGRLVVEMARDQGRPTHHVPRVDPKYAASTPLVVAVKVGGEIGGTPSLLPGGCFEVAVKVVYAEQPDFRGTGRRWLHQGGRVFEFGTFAGISIPRIGG